MMAKNEADLACWMSCIKSASLSSNFKKGMTTLEVSLKDGFFGSELCQLPRNLEDVVEYQRAYYCRKKVEFCMPNYENGLTKKDKFDLREKQIQVMYDIHDDCDAFP
jgi:hypothetical protein